MVRKHQFFGRRFGLRRVVLALFALTLSVVLANCNGSPQGANDAPTPGDAATPPLTGALVLGSGGDSALDGGVGVWVGGPAR